MSGTASGAGTFPTPPLTASAVMLQTLVVTASVTLPSLTSTSALLLDVAAASAAFPTPLFVSAAVAAPVYAATALGVLPALTSGSSLLLDTSVANATFSSPPLSASATAALTFVAATVASLPALTSGSSAQSLAVVASAALPTLTSSGSVVTIYYSPGLAAFPALVSTSSVVGATAVAIAVFPASLASVSTATIVLPAVCVAVFAALTAAAVATTPLPTITPTSKLRNLLGDDPGLTRLYDNILAEVPAVTLPLVQVKAWNTIEDFYMRSTAKRVSINWMMAIGVQEFDFNPYDENWLVCWVLGLSGLTFYQVVPPSIIIDRTPPVAVRTGLVNLALKPVANGYIDDPLLFQQWFETIRAGTLFNLYTMPSRPWSSPQLGQFWGRAFSHGIAKARAIADAAYSNGPGNWNVPYFAAGRRKQ